MAKARREVMEVTVSSPSTTSTQPVNEEEIQQRAYELYLARGCEDGHDLEDWLEAERSLRNERSAA